MSGGALSAGLKFVGKSGMGFIEQSGGTVHADAMVLGLLDGGLGLYTLEGGSLEVGSLCAGSLGRGILSIQDPDAEVTVTSRLCVAATGFLDAAEGATIHMTGADLDLQSTDPLHVKDLANLTLVFAGGDDVSLLEVAGQDLGAAPAGFEANFALGILQIGSEAGVGNVRLADAFDNQPDWAGAEALYVEELILTSGSQLDLNGLTLYYRSLSDLGGTVIGGSPANLRLPGDADGDGSVDDNDLSLLLANWGQAVAGDPDGGWGSGEFDGVSPVNDNDLSLLLANWGGADSGAVPEPAVACLLAMVAPALWRVRRKA
jgi:hypothetical protein